MCLFMPPTVPLHGGADIDRSRSRDTKGIGGFFLMFFAFGFWASWLLASWLLGFSASWLLGFLASRLLGFLAFRLLVGLCGFCIPSSSSAGGVLAFAAFDFSHPLLSQFLSGRFGFCTCSLVFWIWLPASSASPVFSPIWLPPTRLLLRLFAE